MISLCLYCLVLQLLLSLISFSLVIKIKYMNKRTVILILKVVVAVATAILSVLGANALVSCSVKKSLDVQSRGVGVFHYTDTIVTNGNTSILFPYE